MSFDKYKTKGAYHKKWYETEEWYRKSVDKIVDFCRGTFIDAGCGDGLVMTKLIEKWGFLGVGLDDDKEALRLARKERLPVIEFNLEEDVLWFSADYLVCLNTIEHLKSPAKLLDLLSFNVKKAAIIITDVPQEHPSSYHVKEYSPKELADFFKSWRVVPFQIDENFHGIEVYK